MAQPQPEKRSVRRFVFDLPTSVNFLNDAQCEMSGHTRDVSSRGVFMYLDADLAEGVAIEFVMTLPREVTLANPVRVRCQGRVLRVDSKGREQGAAIAIESYDFLAEE